MGSSQCSQVQRGGGKQVHRRSRDSRSSAEEDPYAGVKAARTLDRNLRIAIKSDVKDNDEPSYLASSIRALPPAPQPARMGDVRQSTGNRSYIKADKEKRRQTVQRGSNVRSSKCT
mmetsp:Transcript_99025/g.171622  ORF Transcript_99025/g.171622 Transcript_99025/m.171622 type:complete len:116 (+) Transcript_99025:51-398(+)